MFVQYTFGSQKYVFDGFSCFDVYSGTFEFHCFMLGDMNVDLLAISVQYMQVMEKMVSHKKFWSPIVKYRTQQRYWTIFSITPTLMSKKEWKKLGKTDHFATFLCLPLNCRSFQKIVKTLPFLKKTVSTRFFP